jgi:endonuclease YncB( thermonuclease family)
MKLLIATICYCSLLLATEAYASCGNSENNFCRVKIVKVYDGDTFYVDIPKLHPLFGKRLGIRVFGVDTPELRGGSEYEKQMAKKAKAFTHNFLSGNKKVDLKECVRGKYFRIVCKVYANDKSLSEELINNSLAVPYKE